MKRLLLLLFSFTLFAQDYGNDAETLELCTTLQSNSFSSDLDADNALDRILSVVGLSKNFVLSPCSEINNAVAVSYKGVRYILYDPEFMSMLSSNTSNWTNLFILAHEVGHHVNGHSLDLVLYAGDIVDAPELEKKRQQELEADEFAGFVLAKLGATLSQTTSSVSMLSNEDDIYSTHPKRDRRVASIEKGWDRGYVKKSERKKVRTNTNIKNVRTYSWEYSLNELPKDPNNPFQKLDKKRHLTSSSTANIIDDRRWLWTNPQVGDSKTSIYFEERLFVDKPAPPKLIIEQNSDSEGNYSMTISIENLIDFQYINYLLLKYLQKNMIAYPSYYQPKIVLQIIIGDKAYDFKFCENPNPPFFSHCDNRGNVENSKLSFGKLGSGLRKAKFYLMMDKNFTLKEDCTGDCFPPITYSYLKGSTITPSKFKKDFIKHLKTGNSLYFKIISVEPSNRINVEDLSDYSASKKAIEKLGYDFLMKPEDSDYDDWFNTYYVDLKGSSKALSF
jgi:hypothetical protein